MKIWNGGACHIRMKYALHSKQNIVNLRERPTRQPWSEMCKLFSYIEVGTTGVNSQTRKI